MKKERSRRHIAMLDNQIGMLDQPDAETKNDESNNQNVINNENDKKSSKSLKGYENNSQASENQEGSRREKNETMIQDTTATNNTAEKCVKNKKDLKKESQIDLELVRKNSKDTKQILNDFESKGTITYKQYNQIFQEKTDDIFNERMCIDLKKDKMLSESEITQLKNLSCDMKNSAKKNKQKSDLYKSNDQFGNKKISNLAESETFEAKDFNLSKVSNEINKIAEQEEQMNSATEEIRRLTQSEDAIVNNFLS